MSNKHKSAALPSFGERLAAAKEGAELLQQRIDPSLMLKKKYKRYHIGVDMRKDTFYRSPKNTDQL